jgi:hypothetical protein
VAGSNGIAYRRYGKLGRAPIERKNPHQLTLSVGISLLSVIGGIDAN